MSIWLKPISLEDIQDRNRGTMGDYLGIVITEIGPDFLKGTMPVSERTVQPLKILHGGASVVLAETLASVAANYAVDESHYCVGSEINANHLRPATTGLVTGIARPIRLGRTQQVWTIDMFDDEGKQTCISRMTATVLKR